MSKKITELPAASEVETTDIVPIVDLTNPATTKKATIAQILALVESAVPGGSDRQVQINDDGEFGATDVEIDDDSEIISPSGQGLTSKITTLLGTLYRKAIRHTYDGAVTIKLVIGDSGAATDVDIHYGDNVDFIGSSGDPEARISGGVVQSTGVMGFPDDDAPFYLVDGIPIGVSGTDHTLTASEYACATWLVYGATGGNIIAPAAPGTAFVKNEASGDVVVKKSGGTGVTIASGKSAVIHYRNGGSDWEFLIPPAASSGAPTDASYVTLGTNGTLSNERVLTAGTNIALTDAGAGSTVTVGITGTIASGNLASHTGDVTGAHGATVVEKINGATVPAAGSLTTGHVLKVSGSSATTYGYLVNANVDASAAIAITKIAAGTDGQFLGNVSGTNTWGNAAAYIALNSSAATTGQVRFAGGSGGAVTLATWRHTSTDYDVIAANGSIGQIDFGAGNASGLATRVLGTNVQISTSALSAYINGTQFMMGVPLSGMGFNSLPFRFKVAAITCTAGAASSTTLSSAQYECPILEVTTNADSQVIVAPNNAGTVYIVAQLGSGNNITIKKSGGTGVTIASSQTAWVRNNGTDYVRVTADAA